MAVIVGAAQIRQKPEDPRQAREVVAMMGDAVEGALADAGSQGLGERVDLVVAINGAWRYSDPARCVAERIGAARARTALSADGGDAPMRCLVEAIRRIDAGETQAAVIVGGEGVWSRRRMRAAGYPRAVTEQGGIAPDEILGEELQMSDEHECAHGLEAPLQAYPLFESALRARLGESIERNREEISRLWSGFSAVAAENPYAWQPEFRSAEEIATPSPRNRMVCFPYTKLLTSNWDVDLAAAVVLCSEQLAAQLGVPDGRRVHPVAAAAGRDTDRLSHRHRLGGDAVIRAVGEGLFERAGLTPEEIDHVDLYSCYPAAVRIAADALGLADRDALSVTGGMTFAGGPLNSYVLHSLATMIGRLRAKPGSIGLVTANGGYMTKHLAALFSTEPPAGRFGLVDAQAQIDALPKRQRADSYVGSATIEAYTVSYPGRDGPGRALVSCLLDDGRRAWASSSRDEVIDGLLHAEQVGRRARLDGAGGIALA